MFVFRSSKSWNRTRHAMCTVTSVRLTEQQFDQGLSQNIRFTSLNTETVLYIQWFCVCLTSVACNRHGIEARLCDSKCVMKTQHTGCTAYNLWGRQMHSNHSFTKKPHFKHFLNSYRYARLSSASLRTYFFFFFFLVKPQNCLLQFLVTNCDHIPGIYCFICFVSRRLNLAPQWSKTKKLYVS